MDLLNHGISLDWEEGTVATKLRYMRTGELVPCAIARYVFFCLGGLTSGQVSDWTLALNRLDSHVGWML